MCFQGGYGTENTFENVSTRPSVYQSSCVDVFLHVFRNKNIIKGVHFKVNSAVQFEEILQSYIDAVNREPEEVDIIVFYFSGYDNDVHGLQLF